VEEDRRTPDEWCQRLGVRVLNRIGWEGPFGRPWADPVTFAEFERRFCSSTVRVYDLTRTCRRLQDECG
jgi:hypothetical protein